MAKRRGNGEGTVTKRKDGRWEAKISLPNGLRRSFCAKTRQEVVKKLHQAQRTIAEGLPLANERQTLKEYMGPWLQESVKPSVRPYTYQSYETIVRLHILPEIGRITLARLTAQDVQGLLNRKHKSGLSPRTVQYIHAVLRRALGQAERWGLVPRNIARLVSPPRVPRSVVHPLTPVEAKKLLAVVQSDRLTALYTVALAVGLRQGEALGLRWSDVNLEAGTLSVSVSLQRLGNRPTLTEPKTDKSRRTIKLPEICIAALHDHKIRQGKEHALVGKAWMDEWDLVFTEEDGSPLSRYAVTRRFQRILEGAGIPKRRFHDLRHTCATLLLAQGVPLKVVQEMLGHTLFSTTADIYSHVLPVLMADAAESMNAALTSP